MTTEERVRRLEIIVERLLDALKYKEANEYQVRPFDTQYELLRQYVRGDLGGSVMSEMEA